MASAALRKARILKGLSPRISQIEAMSANMRAIAAFSMAEKRLSRKRGRAETRKIRASALPRFRDGAGTGSVSLLRERDDRTAGDAERPLRAVRDVALDEAAVAVQGALPRPARVERQLVLRAG